MELSLVAVILVSLLIGIRFANRSSRRAIRGMIFTGLSCLALGLAGFFAIAAGLPLPIHPYRLGLLIFLLLVVAGALLPCGLIGLWISRSRTLPR